MKDKRRRAKDGKKEISRFMIMRLFFVGQKTKDERREKIEIHGYIMIIGDITGDINEGDIFVKDFADKRLSTKRHGIGAMVRWSEEEKME